MKLFKKHGWSFTSYVLLNTTACTNCTNLSRTCHARINNDAYIYDSMLKHTDKGDSNNTNLIAVKFKLNTRVKYFSGVQCNKLVPAGVLTLVDNSTYRFLRIASLQFSKNHHVTAY